MYREREFKKRVRAVIYKKNLARGGIRTLDPKLTKLVQ